MPTPIQPGAPGTDSLLFGRYRLVQRLGVGAGGETWRAEPVQGGDPVAIKVVSHEGLPSRGTTDLLREAAVLQGLRHPHVVQYLGIVDLPGALSTFLIMEYVEGGNLAEWMERRRPIAPADVAGLLQQVADALSFLHGAGILHRDLKPANVLVRPVSGALPVLLVADFGISRPLVGGFAPHTRPAGTPGYSPPEAWRGLEVTAAADVYSLGALAWNLLASPIPLPPPGSAPDKVAALLRSRVGSGADALIELTIQMLRENPADRPTVDQVRRVLAPAAPRAGTGCPPTLPPRLSTALGGVTPPGLEPASPVPEAWVSAPEVPDLPTPTLSSGPVSGDLSRSSLPRPGAGRWVQGLLLAAGVAALACAGIGWWATGGSADGASVSAGWSAPVADAAPTPAAPASSPRTAPVPSTSSAGPPSPALSGVPAGSPAVEPPMAVPSPSARASAPAFIATGFVGRLRVGVKGGSALPSDAELVVTTAGGSPFATRNAQATLDEVRSGEARIEVRTPTRTLAATTVQIPPGELVLVHCESLSASFDVLTCAVAQQADR